jgi:hypothetical protein
VSADCCEFIVHLPKSSIALGSNLCANAYEQGISLPYDSEFTSKDRCLNCVLNWFKKDEHFSLFRLTFYDREGFIKQIIQSACKSHACHPVESSRSFSAAPDP